MLPWTVIKEFAKIKSGDVVLPARAPDGRISKTIHLRCITEPDQHQQVLLNRLGLTLPRRLEAQPAQEKYS